MSNCQQTREVQTFSPVCREALLQLLQAALWEQTPQDDTFAMMTPRDWETVFHVSRQQTVGALACQGLTFLPDDLQPAESLQVMWMAELGQVERQSRRMNRALTSLLTLFEEQEGLKPVLLKGQGLARLYGCPLLRESGDIDLCFPDPAERERAHRLLARQGIRPEKKADGSWLYTWQGVPVEHHPRMTDLANPFARRYLQRLEEQHPCVQVPLGMGTDRQVNVPSPVLSLLLQSVHILHHVIGWGIGLRQMADMAVTCRSIQGQTDVRTYGEASSRLHLGEWNSLLHGFLVDCLALPRECLPYEGPLADSHILQERIWEDGNFGQNHSVRHSSGGSSLQGKCRTACSMLRHAGLGWRYAPRETFFTLASLMTGQFF